MEYTFTLKYMLADADVQAGDAVVERLGAAGCTDALVGTGQVGRLAIEFVREAASADAALYSALSDVKRALPNARLIEAAPDFVGLTDVAELVGMTRQNMRKLMCTHYQNFPVPVHEGSAAIWHLADILGWMQRKGSYQLEQSLIDMATLAMQLNLAKEVRQLVPAVQQEVQAYLV